MKDKRLLYVLLPAVVAIWMIIGYRFYHAVKGEDTAVSTVAPVNVITPEEDTTIYQLQFNYPDPFMKKITVAPSIAAATLPTHQLPVTAARPAAVPATSSVDWEAIAYLGMIENNQTEYRVGIIVVNGQRHLVREQDQIASFSIGRILKDSLQVGVKTEVRYIAREGKIDWLSQSP